MSEEISNKTAFREGVRDGIPIMLGYLVVGFTIGIAAINAGLTPFQAFLASLLNNASAGEYAGFTTIAANAGYLEIILITIVANARYLLMCCVLSQKFSPDAPLWQRLLIGFDATDEIFGITIARPGWLNPYYNYGAMSVAIPGWAFGTLLGAVASNILPTSIAGALPVALYGMFLAIIIPPAHDCPLIGKLVGISFALSYLATIIPVISTFSEGTRTIIITLLVAGSAAYFFPVPNTEEEGNNE